MEKSPFTREYSIFLEHLRRARLSVSVTQAELATRLAATQSFVSKCERGERRLDFIEVRAWCHALDISFMSFLSKLDKSLKRHNVQ